MRGGFFIQDITPRIGVEMAGFGPYLNRRATGVYEALEARAAAFESEQGKVVIVSCDLITLTQEVVQEVQSLVRDQHPELTNAQIMVCATHTHSGPAIRNLHGWGAVDPVYLEILPSKIAAAALRALDELRPVIMHATQTPCPGIGINRSRESVVPDIEDVLRDNWQPEHPEFTDTKCTVLRFADANSGTLVGFIVNFGCHPVTCCAENHYLHGDYPGVAMHRLMSLYPESVGVFLQGALGDVVTACVNQPAAQSIRALDVLAGRMVQAVEPALIANNPVSRPLISFAEYNFNCTVAEDFTPEALKKIVSEQELFLRNYKNSDSDEKARMAAVYLSGARSLLRQYPGNFPSQIKATLHGIRLGPIALLGTPFEVMQGIKNSVTAQSGTPFPLVLSLCGGSMGYAPDRENSAKAQLYENSLVPLINGRFPYKCIYDELTTALIELDRILNIQNP